MNWIKLAGPVALAALLLAPGGVGAQQEPAAPVDPATVRPAFDEVVGPVLAEATLTQPDGAWAPAGGRTGVHTEHLAYLLAEMQVLHRAHPGARW